MLIICNGTFKSGSSWIHAIIVEIYKIKQISLDEVPLIYNPNQASPTRILEKNLNNFLLDEDYKKKNYITKAHFFCVRTLEKDYSDNVKFIFIRRDIKDAIISHYLGMNMDVSVIYTMAKKSLFDEYDITFPLGLVILNLPDDFFFSTFFSSFLILPTCLLLIWFL